VLQLLCARRKQLRRNRCTHTYAAISTFSGDNGAATNCTTLHHTTPHCTTHLRHCTRILSEHCNCNTIQHTPVPPQTHLAQTLQLNHSAAHCYTLEHTATHCNTLQHTATHGYSLQHPPAPPQTYLACGDCIDATECCTVRCSVCCSAGCQNLHVLPYSSIYTTLHTLFITYTF